MLERMPPLKILGITGPLGSGCSTVSTLFDIPGKDRTKPNQLMRILCAEQTILKKEEGYEIEWSSLNAAVEEACHGEFEAEEVLRKLECREARHGLENLLQYYSEKGHLFRTISLSDLIVFHTIVALEKRHFRTEGVIAPYRKFADIVASVATEAAKVMRKRLGIDGYGKYYEALDNLSRNRKALSKAFGWFHILSRRIKDLYRKEEPTMYSEVMQDFGDNLRRCADPFDKSSKGDARCSAIIGEDLSRMIDLLYAEGIAAFFVLDSLRNPYEVIYLRNRYASFYLSRQS